MADAAQGERSEKQTPQGDAAAAVARIEAFLASRQVVSTSDYDAVLEALSARLAELMSIDIVAGDRECRTILDRMAMAEDMEAFAADVDVLEKRVAIVLATLPPGRRARRTKAASAENDTRSDIGRSGRMILRL